MMIIKRRLYSQPSQNLTPKETAAMASEQMKQQRSLLNAQKSIQKSQLESQASNLKSSTTLKKAEIDKQRDVMNNLVKIRKLEDTEERSKTAESLVKTRTKPIPPIPMKT